MLHSLASLLLGVSVLSPACLVCQQSPPVSPAITLPAGIKIEAAVIRPVFSARVKTGGALDAQTIFPVTTEAGIAIPAGTYVLGRITSVLLPTRRLAQATVAHSAAASWPTRSVSGQLRDRRGSWHHLPGSRGHGGPEGEPKPWGLCRL